MPLYKIRRDVPGATRDEVDASGFRALICGYEYEGLRWIRSYWDAEAGELNCLYEAVDEEQLRDHARRSRIPCDDIREVVELMPHFFADPEAAKANEGLDFGLRKVPSK